MNVTQDMIDKWKSRLAFKSKPTQDLYFIVTDKFLTQYNGDLSEQNIIDFLSIVSKNSIRTIFYALRFFYKVNSIPFELKIEDVAPKGGVKVIREILTNEEIEKLIKSTKLNYGTIEIGYLAIATIYGARRVELYNLQAEDFNIGNGKFKIYTAKGGQEERIHIIPEEIKEIIGDLWFGLKKVKRKPVITAFNMLFDRMCLDAEIELRPRLGWHSIRRKLVSELQIAEPVINPNIIRHFLRWKPRASDIILDYTILEPERVDKRIFEQHPFLKLWK